MKCSKCGNLIEDKARFCPYCGAKQNAGVFTPLVERALEGDQTAISELYARTCEKVRFAVKVMIKDDDTVDDIVQDSYMKGFKSLTQLKDAESYQAWMKQIAHNKAVDWLRSNHKVRYVEEFLPMEEMEAQERMEERVENLPDEAMDRKETTRLLNEILDAVPEEQRAVVCMYYYDQLTLREIAEKLDISENTVKSRLTYGRKKVELQVRDLEKKGTKLYSLAPLPFFLALLHSAEVKAWEVPAASVFQAVRAAGAEAVASGAASAAHSAARATASGTGRAAGNTAGGTAGRSAGGANGNAVSGEVPGRAAARGTGKPAGRSAGNSVGNAGSGAGKAAGSTAKTAGSSTAKQAAKTAGSSVAKQAAKNAATGAVKAGAGTVAKSVAMKGAALALAAVVAGGGAAAGTVAVKNAIDRKQEAAQQIENTEPTENADAIEITPTPEATPTPEPTPTPSAEELAAAAKERDLELYQDLLEECVEICQNPAMWYEGTTYNFSESLARMGSNALDSYGYALIDLDGNGVNELAIADTTEGTDIMNLYTLKDGKPITPGGATGVRDWTQICEGGYIFRKSLWGVSIGNCWNYMKFNEAGDGFETVDSVVQHGFGDDGQVVPVHWDYNNQEVSEEQANKIINDLSRVYVPLSLDVTPLSTLLQTSADAGLSPDSPEAKAQDLELYRGKLDAYYTAWENNWSDMDNEFLEQNELPWDMGGLENIDNIGYALEDINNDGVNELILVSGMQGGGTKFSELLTDGWEHPILGVYTVIDGQVKGIAIQPNEVGPRYVCEGGVILHIGREQAMYYRITDRLLEDDNNWVAFEPLRRYVSGEIVYETDGWYCYEGDIYNDDIKQHVTSEQAKAFANEYPILQLDYRPVRELFIGDRYYALNN